jgi:hypothetical protein
MADQKNPQNKRDKTPRELDERQLEQASGGRVSLSDFTVTKKLDKASPG